MFFKLVTDEKLNNYTNDLADLLRAYGVFSAEDGEEISCRQEYLDGKFLTSVSLLGKEYKREDGFTPNGDEIIFKRLSKRYVKLLLYRALVDVTGRELPWGSLTGIRPTSMLHELKREGKGESELVSEFGVSRDKARLASEILKNQREIRIKSEDNVDLYINVPFCVSRCSYCSFISALISDKKRWVKPYLDALIEEYRASVSLIKSLNKTVNAVYIGGGTPTSLSDDDFSRLMAEITVKSDFPNAEYTVEAGRPDTVTSAKLVAMERAGVNRISINPQTFNDATLELIGRRHTSEDTVRAYLDARRHPFLINMDLISALPGESYEDFCRSVDRTVELMPDNVTVHTLAIKRSSVLKTENYDNNSLSPAEKMTEYASSKLREAGYEPYYMYRQKNMSANLENTGYMRNGTICRYNVDNMEELCSVLAIGAGGISKRITGSRIERCSNNKNIEEYVRTFREIIAKREAFFTEKV